MMYLVLYTKSVRSYNGGRSDQQYIDVSIWVETQDKIEAIELARKHKGVIVEAFEFDIKKDKHD